MPEISIPTVGIYEALTALTAYFVGKTVVDQASKSISSSTRTSPAPDPAPDQDPDDDDSKKPKLVPLPGCTKNCNEKEMCPVCGQAPNPTPGFQPAYVPDNRLPLDSETLPPLNSYTRTPYRVKGARVWQRGDGTYIHRDTLHKGKGAELEVYDKRGKWIKAICPHCGTERPTSNPPEGRKIPGF